MTVVYIDRVFALNALVDYLLLLTTARLAGTPLRRLRFGLCAVLGGIYAAAVFYLPGLAGIGWKLLLGLGISALAFCREDRMWRLMALFFLLSGGLAGLLLGIGIAIGQGGAVLQKVYCADISWPVLLGSAAGFYLLLHLVFRQGARHGGGELLEITISIGGRSVGVRALHDTGNTLRDPIRGKPVLVAEQSALRELWQPEIGNILSASTAPEAKMSQLCCCGSAPHFTLLPFCSVGQAHGLLLAVRSDYIEMAGKKLPGIWIALCDSPVSDGGGYHALWGGRGKEAENAAIDANPPMDSETVQAG